MKKMILACSISAFASFPALAQSTYAGVSIGQAKVDIDSVASPENVGSQDDTDTSLRAFFGADIHPNISVEVGYIDLGNFWFRETKEINTFNAAIESSAIYIDSIGKLQAAAGLNLYGKLGLARTRTKLRVADNGLFGFGSRSISDSETNLKYGVGAEYMIHRNVGLRAEYEAITNVGNDEATGGDSAISHLSAGVFYRF